MLLFLSIASYKFRILFFTFSANLLFLFSSIVEIFIYSNSSYTK
nr:MAG TPA: hypothetical protein [Crassvirales sp.]